VSEGLSIVLGNAMPLSITLSLPSGLPASGLFPRALIYDSADSLVATRDPTEVGSTGRYTDAGFTPSAAGTFTAWWTVYSNAGHTVVSPFWHRDQDVFVVKGNFTAADRATIARILGLVQNNFMLDEQTYDSKGLLLTGRIRVFADPTALGSATAGAADDADSEIARYNITVVAATAGEATDYRVAQEL
jgi:hypothetical protein